MAGCGVWMFEIYTLFYQTAQPCSKKWKMMRGGRIQGEKGYQHPFHRKRHFVYPNLARNNSKSFGAPSMKTICLWCFHLATSLRPYDDRDVPDLESCGLQDAVAGCRLRDGGCRGSAVFVKYHRRGKEYCNCKSTDCKLEDTVKYQLSRDNYGRSSLVRRLVAR